ncbi:SAM-dependent methyltransferase [Streptomyces sp. AV19]|uniref:methyltransferase n=1 Tax=Streptomyces sp. AV19 TaxID=2793068 RepID=UPI0018FE81EF|nr:methyltransferase [Streptomyces sp. AV19]MBH1935836.1 SAM-dependent methyltransferase [Streptomyces sp. AV19]MDG4534021.1 methyltransferase [Streptomyces sp. AV19]
MAVEKGPSVPSPADRTSAAFLIDEALGYLFPAALRAAAAVGVADHLADGPRTPAELAAATGTDGPSLHRVLRLLATRGVLSQAAGGRFGLTPAGNALRSDAPASARAAILMITDRTMWLPAGEMQRCLTDGTSAFEGIFGTSFFGHFARDETTAAVFHDGMAAMSDAENRPIAAAGEFPEKGTVVDVGGGHGGFLAEVLRDRPGLNGVLYDASHVLAGHRLAEDRDLAGRWSTAEGDFFTEVPPGDVHLLKRILHDWRDDQCVTLLRNCRRALAPGGRILVVDAVVPKDSGPHQAKALDLMMMASLVGRERTEADFRALFEAAGLRLARIIPTSTVLDIVEAVPDGTGE